jgi:hypothetical protein
MEEIILNVNNPIFLDVWTCRLGNVYRQSVWIVAVSPSGQAVREE